MTNVADEILDDDTQHSKRFKRAYRLMVKHMLEARVQAIEAASKHGTEWLYEECLTSEQVTFVIKCNKWASKFLEMIGADDPGDPPIDPIS